MPPLALNVLVVPIVNPPVVEEELTFPPFEMKVLPFFMRTAAKHELPKPSGPWPPFAFWPNIGTANSHTTLPAPSYSLDIRCLWQIRQSELAIPRRKSRHSQDPEPTHWAKPRRRRTIYKGAFRHSTSVSGCRLLLRFHPAERLL